MSKFCIAFVAPPEISGFLLFCSSNSARISGSTVIFGSVAGWRLGEDSARRGNLLLSMRYGMPTTRQRERPAIRIMGFLSRLNGETVMKERRKKSKRLLFS
jgi:hypothetical protein